MSSLLASGDFDTELTPGARNAVQVCLRVQPGEKVTLIADEACLDIGRAIAHELEVIGSRVSRFLLEELAPRPLVDMPPTVLADLETSQVSIFAVQAQANELRSRMQMTEVVNRREIRHAHMVNITPRIMMEGMRADYGKVDELSRRLLEITQGCRQIRATTPAGTDLVATMNSDYKWLKTSGIISRRTWGNLPGGEVWTTPGEVNGVFVVDGVVGDYLCAKYGDLRDTPLRLQVSGNRLRECFCDNKALEDEFWRYTHTDENSDRVGEFAIGTNIGVRGVIGNILQDEKIPGLHIAFGNPYGDHTGARWFSSTHIDVVGRNFDIWADEVPLMRRGEFTISV
jgi:leucyl aminopeptidase (aminopeptidase T)